MFYHITRTCLPCHSWSCLFHPHSQRDRLEKRDNAYVCALFKKYNVPAAYPVQWALYMESVVRDPVAVAVAQHQEQEKKKQQQELELRRLEERAKFWGESYSSRANFADACQLCSGKPCPLHYQRSTYAHDALQQMLSACTTKPMSTTEQLPTRSRRQCR